VLPSGQLHTSGGDGRRAIPRPLKPGAATVARTATMAPMTANMTAEEVFAFRESLQATLTGYVQPRAYGVGVHAPQGWHFPVTNTDGFHRLPAVVLAAVLGHRHGTRAHALSPAQLGQAIDILAPVEACTAFEHPNLWSWRALLAAHPAGPFVAVFVDDEPAGYRATAGG
jgi:hypothetical protein